MRALGCVSVTVFFVACKPGLSPQETGDLSESDADTDADADTDTDTDTDTSLPERECPEPVELGDTGSFQGTPPNPGFVMLLDPLDSPKDAHYCADVAGKGVEADDILNAHTCKAPIDNEPFATDSPEFGQIASANFSKLCIESGSVTEGGSLRMETCSTATTQSWVSSEAGEIHPADDLTLCWVVDSEAGTPVGGGAGNGELRRPLTLERCDSVEDARKLWAVPCGNVGTWGTQKGS